MPPEDTNPNMVSLGRVFTEIKDMRKDSKENHRATTKTLNKHSIQLACLETKWATFWKVLKWAAPLMGAAIGVVVGVKSLW